MIHSAQLSITSVMPISVIPCLWHLSERDLIIVFSLCLFLSVCVCLCERECTSGCINIITVLLISVEVDLETEILAHTPLR